MSSAEGVRGFYSGKNLFITGGTGFVGSCLLEKIMYEIPEHGTIYLLLRAKKNADAAQRLEEIRKNKIYKVRLTSEQEEKGFSKIVVVAGDVGQDNLGMSPADRKLVADNVDVIFHSAATLDFGENLRTTVNVNLLGTRRVLELAKECAHLKAFVHVSSAYANSFQKYVDDIMYPLLMKTEDVLALTEKYGDEALEKKTPSIIGEHPNTYTFTKHMAEHEVQKLQEVFPCTIVRPSMIVGSWNSPTSGWTMSKNGPQGFILGASKGVVRRLPVATKLIYDYIPVDIVVNTLLAAGFYVGVNKPKEVAIYHSCSSLRNPFRWECVEEHINEELIMCPLSTAVWYPHLKFLPSLWRFKISAFFVHYLPALLLDNLTRVCCGRPMLVKLHNNINTSLDRLEKFIFSEWIFNVVNTEDLHAWLQKSDHEAFGVTIKGLIWRNHILNLVRGVRYYLCNEDIHFDALGRERLNRLFYLHYSFQALLYFLVWFVFGTLLGLSTFKSLFILPLFYLFMKWL